MNSTIDFELLGQKLTARASGALWWDAGGILCVSDLHLGKAERIARRGGGLLPPYETQDTLLRLQGEIDALNPRTVICLGDSFDDLDAAASLNEDQKGWVQRLQAGRNWIWIEGNHDPGPVEFGGSHLFEFERDGLVFRHIALDVGEGEISGHYHPKARVAVGGRAISRACFLVDDRRVIMPAFGTYTGGLRTDDVVFSGLMAQNATAILVGKSCHKIPMPRTHKGK